MLFTHLKHNRQGEVESIGIPTYVPACGVNFEDLIKCGDRQTQRFERLNGFALLLLLLYRFYIKV